MDCDVDVGCDSVFVFVFVVNDVACDVDVDVDVDVGCDVATGIGTYGRIGVSSNVDKDDEGAGA